MTRTDPTTMLSRVAVASRGGEPESWHHGAAATVAVGGRIVFKVGDPATATFMRSTAKPFQVLPLVMAEGVDGLGLDTADLALMCGSHAGTDVHVERVRSLLARVDLDEGDLLCGSHPPFDDDAAARLRRGGRHPTPMHNNCSGKHAGMLLACRLLGLPTGDYVAAEHPLQRRIQEFVAEICGIESEMTGLAIDGCGVPTYRMPLTAMARGYVALAAPRRAGLDEALATALESVVEAMANAPEMVAGPGRFTTRLIDATGGRVIGKEGAEGVYAAAVRGPTAFGVVLKIGDGGDRCRDGVVLGLLRGCEALADDELAALADLRIRERRNRRGDVVGAITPEVRIEEIGR